MLSANVFVYYNRFLQGVGTQNVGFAPTFYFGKNWVVDNFQIAKKVRGFADSIVAENGLELVHVEIVGAKTKPTVRVLIDKPEGITHDDCSSVSTALSKILDREDFILSAYVLEVSSPGIERGLYSIEDFERFADHIAKVKMGLAINGQRNFSGKIVSASDGQIEFDDKTNGLVKLPFDGIKKAKLKVDVSGDLKRSAKK